MGHWQKYTLPNLAFVKIEYDALNLEDGDEDDPPVRKLVWVGVAGQYVDATDGGQVQNPDNPSQRVDSGFQHFRCVGLEWLLDRQYIQHAQVDGNTVGYAPDFGLNRQEGGGFPIGTFNEFSNKKLHDETGDPWSTRQIVEYLLENHGPKIDGTLDPVMQWNLVNESAVPDWGQITLQQHGFTTGALLRRLLSRQRGLGYFVRVAEADPADADAEDKVELVAFTFVESDFDLTGGNTLPANNIAQFVLNFSGDHSGSSFFTDDAFSRYTSVRVQGERATLTFSAEPERISDRDFSADARAAITAAEDDTELRSQQLADFISDPQIDAEARLHKLDIGDMPKRPKWSSPSEMEDEPTYHQDKIVLPRLALQLGQDYDEEAKPENPPLREDPVFYERPFWVVKEIGEDEDWYDTRFVGNRVRENYNWSASVSPGGSFLTIDLNSRNVVLSALEGEEFNDLKTSLNGGPTPTFNGSMVTATILLDHFCEVVETIQDPPELAKEKLIRVGGRNRRLDLIAKDTVVGVKPDKTLKKHTIDGWIRDDRELLRPIAKQALAWYGQSRQTMSMTTGWINGNLTLGSLITEVTENGASHVINSPITQISIQSPVSQSTQVAVPKISYQTSFAELDFA